MLKRSLIWVWTCLLLTIVKAQTLDQINPEEITTTEDEAESTTPANTAQYRFHYYVRDDATGDFKTQEETRDGSAVKGSYTVAEPNGDLRTVKYTAAAGRGFEATVDITPGGSPMGIISQKKTKTVNKLNKSEFTKEKSNMPMTMEETTLGRKFQEPIKKSDSSVIGILPKFKSTLESQENLGKLKEDGYTVNTSSEDEMNSPAENVEAIVQVQGDQYSVEVRSRNKNDKSNEDELVQSYHETSFSRRSPTIPDKMSTYKMKYMRDHVPNVQSKLFKSTEGTTETPPPNSTNKVAGQEVTNSSLGTSVNTPLSEATTSEKRTEKPGEIQLEVEKIMKAIPTIPDLHLFHDYPFQKDVEEAAIDERITEVARQLAEASLRQEYEDRKLAHIIPIRLLDNYDESQTSRSSKDSSRRDVGKSFEFPPKSLPLVGRLPVETAQLQLITEVQTVPHHVYREGFDPMTPAPELSGPLLGGPPLKNNPRALTGIASSPIRGDDSASKEVIKDVDSHQVLLTVDEVAKKDESRVPNLYQSQENEEHVAEDIMEDGRKIQKKPTLKPEGKTLRFPMWDKRTDTYTMNKNQERPSVRIMQAQPNGISLQTPEISNPILLHLPSNYEFSRMPQYGVRYKKEDILRTSNQPNGHQYPYFSEQMSTNQHSSLQIPQNKNRLFYYFKPQIQGRQTQYEVLRAPMNIHNGRRSRRV